MPYNFEIHRLLRLFLAGLFVFAAGLTAHAQSAPGKNKSPFPVKYTSLVDQKILLKTITLAPVYDNVGGIYSGPVQKLLVDLLQNDKVWGYSEFPDFDKKIFIEKFESQPNDVLEVLNKTKAQGLLTAFITKGPRGLNARLKLFTQDQGLILLEESFQDMNTFEVSKLRESFAGMYHELKNRLPYRGYVLSRRGLDVTLNLGSMNGVKAGQELALAQILKLNRHPKLKTLVGVEKEIIAKVKITKVEPYLSFAQIIFEKETGVVDVGAKVLPSEYVAYPVPVLNAAGEVTGDAPAGSLQEPAAETKATEAPAEAPVTASENQEKAKLLDRRNSSGIITAQGVVTQYKEISELASGATPGSSQSFAPGAFLGLQLFFMKNFFADLNMQMNMFSASNGLAGSTPPNLSYTYTRYSGVLGYDYYLDDEDTAPEDAIKISGGLGYVSYNTDVSTSTPTSLTSTQTNDLILQAKAAMPLTPEYPFTVGMRVDISLAPKFSESPVSSGDSKPTVTALGLFGYYTVSDRLRARADLNVTNISSRFTGTFTRPDRATSTSIQMISEQIGVEYLF